jgi:Uma2 family endonuclease
MKAMKFQGPATLDDLMKIPKDGRIYELVDGQIIVSPAGMRHSEVAARITRMLGEFVDKSSSGKVYGEDVGILLPNGNLRSPDVTFVTLAKLPDGKSPESFGAVIPDLAV